jgi:hypothetical protein
VDEESGIWRVCTQIGGGTVNIFDYELEAGHCGSVSDYHVSGVNIFEEKFLFIISITVCCMQMSCDHFQIVAKMIQFC